MDIVASLKDTDIAVIFNPTRDAFVPLLEAHRADIESIKRTTFKYGITERQQLDVYHPPSDSTLTSRKAPLLFFVYGGGFVEGDRQFSSPYDLGYVNVGAFFAKQGFLTVIPDYRLVPSVTYPEPVKDVRDAISWVVENAEKITSEASIQVDLHSIFLMGHSAGATHVSTAILYPGLIPAGIRARIRGLILKGGAFSFAEEDGVGPLILPYYLSWEVARAQMPTTLVERASDDVIANFPDVLLMASEREPRGGWKMSEDFAAILKKRMGNNFVVVPMKGHNHISPHWALCTGQGEDWAVEVAEWIKVRAASK
ncbi:alpha/beta-hydrolase [Sparassis crispa]|uniref:Alpha/beta-hydrolase n=1 Tax=Sparassis crispa TaxID=139825 RepID=A0A401GUG3_9APHY|nr:alpha/beta-hydrolase [Sparassis crispa]GBE85877.1 alpha/beta-hydrolase [Sparassis crispa]